MLAIAAFRERTTPRLVEAPCPPDPGPGQVLCRTLELGVCGTDREILHSRHPLVPPGDEFLILGHECLARVEAVGPGVAAPRVGDLVVPIVRRKISDPVQFSTSVGWPLDHQDQKLPRQNQPRPDAASHALASRLANRRVDMLPFGTYTERGIVREHGFSMPLWLDEPRHLFPVPAQIAPIAVLAEPLAVAAKAINEARRLQRARLGEIESHHPPRVLVTGMGPIGFAALIGARYLGWPVTMYGRDRPESFRARLVRDLGGEYLAADQAGDFEGRDAEADGFDLLLECTGSEDVIVRTAAALASCGVMVWLGSSRTPQPAHLNVAALIRHGLLRNHLYIGSVNAAPRDFYDALAWLVWLQRTQPRQVEQLITSRVSPSDSLWHYEHRQPQGIKTVLVYT